MLGPVAFEQPLYLIYQFIEKVKYFFEKDRHLPIVYFEVDSFSFHNVQVIFWYFLMLRLMLKSLPQVGKV